MISDWLPTIAVVVGLVVIFVKGGRWFGALGEKVEHLQDTMKKQNGTDKALENRLHEKVEVSDCDKFQKIVSEQLNILVQHALEE